jgi:DNA-binding transcriptional regulator LsrR (DeoR family)
LSKQEIHIGWSGGDSMARIAAALARILTEPASGLPERLILHALVSGFDVERPMTAPNVFFSHFMSPALLVKVDFVGLHAPAIIKSEDAESFLTLPGIREARDLARDLDIVVTSAASFTDDHGMLKRYCQQVDPSGQLVERLRKDGCVGDMLWLPMSVDGPMNVDRYPYRGLTVIDLEMLPQFIRRGKKILLSLGVCGLCKAHKADILKAILGQKDAIISHLVTDSRTARALLE